MRICAIYSATAPRARASAVTLYAADCDVADGKAFLERGAGDRHQFRFIVAPEDGAEYADLKPLVRRWMNQVEQDLGTKLDWVGGDTIPVSVALFDLSSFDGEIVSDLFGDERYFASSEAFWVAQQSAIDAKVGEQLAVDMAAVWQPDAAFLDGLRDREVLLAMVREVGGDVVADGNADAKAKVLRGILTDHIEGSNGREKVEGWVPGWMAFPASTYTDRGGVGSVMRTAHVATMTTPAAANDDTEIVQPEAAS